jgi:hypothetical protein
MTTYKYSLLYCLGIAIGLCCALTGCEKDLNKVPETALSDADYWKTTNDLKEACNYLYSFLPTFDEMRQVSYSDDSFGTVPNNISNGSRQVTASSTEWNSNYRLIRNCNNILEKSALVKGDQKTIDRFKAEAHFFRAFGYFELIKRFGEVPLFTRTYDVFDSLATAGRSPKELILDVMYSDLDFASMNLPAPNQIVAAEFGRISSTAALALKARIALHMGTWNKFHQTGDAAKHLNIAIAASDAIIKTGLHALYNYAASPAQSYYRLFQYDGEGAANKENILVRLYGENSTNNIASNSYSSEARSGAGPRPTRVLADAYLYKDGLPIGKSPFEKPQTGTVTEFENRDPRMIVTIANTLINTVIPNTGQVTAPTFSFAPTGYKSFKYLIPSEVGALIFGFRDYMAIRYAEVLLIYAEAKYELQNSVSDQDLELSVNVVRRRAGMPGLTNQFVTDNGLSMREEIRRERRVELALEGGHRYWDILRWKIAEIELPKTVMGIKFFPAEYGTGDGQGLVLSPEGYVITERSTVRKFDPLKDYLWPLPTQDIAVNLNLTQNPGWK